MDLLRSVSGNFTLEVWIGDRLAHVYIGSLGTREEDLLLDPDIHGYQDRYRRVLDTLQEHAAGYLDAKYGDESPGLDGFRRWVRLPIHPVDLVGRDTLEVSLVLAQAGEGAYVELFGDQALAATDNREFLGPSFFLNPYRLSNYRFRLLAGDRREADYRLWSKIELESPRAESVLLREGKVSWDLSRDPGIQTGEYRIRLRLRLPGQYVLREGSRGRRLQWATSFLPGDELPTGEDIRRRMSVQDDVDGYATF